MCWVFFQIFFFPQNWRFFSIKKWDNCDSIFFFIFHILAKCRTPKKKTKNWIQVNRGRVKIVKKGITCKESPRPQHTLRKIAILDASWTSMSGFQRILTVNLWVHFRLRLALPRALFRRRRCSSSSACVHSDFVCSFCVFLPFVFFGFLSPLARSIVSRMHRLLSSDVIWFFLN